MKKSAKAAAVLAMLAMLVGVAGCGGDTKQAGKDKTCNVGILQLVEHPALDAANKGFVDGLKSKGFEEGKNIKFDRQNAQGDQSNLQTIAQRFVSNKVNLVCAIATPAAQTMANATKDIPIVGTAITDYKVAKLVKDNSQPGTNVTGTTDMNPVEAQIDLLVKIMPKARTVGFIYNSSEVNSQLHRPGQKGGSRPGPEDGGSHGFQRQRHPAGCPEPGGQGRCPVRAYGQCAGLRHAQPDQDHR